jgi:hypothetical protein
MRSARPCWTSPRSPSYSPPSYPGRSTAPARPEVGSEIRGSERPPNTLRERPACDWSPVATPGTRRSGAAHRTARRAPGGTRPLRPGRARRHPGRSRTRARSRRPARLLAGGMFEGNGIGWDVGASDRGTWPPAWPIGPGLGGRDSAPRHPGWSRVDTDANICSCDVSSAAASGHGGPIRSRAGAASPATSAGRPSRPMTGKRCSSGRSSSRSRAPFRTATRRGSANRRSGCTSSSGSCATDPRRPFAEPSLSRRRQLLVSE